MLYEENVSSLVFGLVWFFSEYIFPQNNNSLTEVLTPGTAITQGNLPERNLPEQNLPDQTQHGISERWNGGTVEQRRPQ